MANMVELNRYGLWVGKQTAKGSPNAAPSKRLIQVAGDFNAPRNDGTEAWSDLSKYGNQTDWINDLVGNGNPGIEATPEELAYVFWLHHGAETVTSITGPPAKQKHAFTPQPGLGFWSTWFKRLGQSSIQRHQYNDCQITQLVVEGSTANKAVRVTPTIISLDPAQLYASDPAASVPTKTPFLYTDGAASFTVDGSVFRGQSQFTLTINEDYQPVYSDSITVYDLQAAAPSVTLGITMFFDSDGLAQFNKQLYGTTTPTAGTRPLTRLPGYGSYSFALKAKDNTGALNGDEFDLTIANVKWALPDSPGPNPAGGPPEISLAGAMRSPTSPPYELDVLCDAAAFTV